MVHSQNQHSPSSDRMRVLLAEPKPIMRTGLTHLINQEHDFWVCGEADDTEGIIKAVTNLTPHLVLLELSLSGSSGLELIRTIRRQAPKVRILVLSSYDETLYAFRSLRAGAQGYLSKNITPFVLIEAIRKVFNGDIVVSEQLRTQLVQHAVTGRMPPGMSWGVDLTDREIEVLNFIGEGLSTREIADALHLSIKTVETYRSHLIKKLSLPNSRTLLRYAIHWVTDHETAYQPLQFR